MSFALALGTARAETLRVAIGVPTRDGLEATNRLVAELRSAAYELSWFEPGRGSPCAGGSALLELPPPAALIELEHQPESGVVLAVICYVRGARAFEQTSIDVPAGDPTRLALAVVEALNGLGAQPLPRRQAPFVVIAPDLPPSRAAFAEAALATDAIGKFSILGARLALQANVSERFGVQLEAFVPVREGEVSGADRDLSLRAAWAAVGPRLSWITPPLRFGFTITAGPTLVWVSARTNTAERVGTTSTTSAAIISSSVWLEYPSDAALYLRAGGHVSRLLPSVEVALGDGSFQPYGELLLDVGLGLGVRWGSGG